MAHNNLVYREHKSLLERTGLRDKGTTIHALLHTFATALFVKGELPKVVHSLLGHSSITQTIHSYSHVMEGMCGDQVDGQGEVFG